MFVHNGCTVPISMVVRVRPSRKHTALNMSPNSDFSYNWYLARSCLRNLPSKHSHSDVNNHIRFYARQPMQVMHSFKQRSRPTCRLLNRMPAASQSASSSRYLTQPKLTLFRNHSVAFYYLFNIALSWFNNIQCTTFDPIALRPSYNTRIPFLEACQELTDIIVLSEPPRGSRYSYVGHHCRIDCRSCSSATVHHVHHLLLLLRTLPVPTPGL